MVADGDGLGGIDRPAPDRPHESVERDARPPFDDAATRSSRLLPVARSPSANSHHGPVSWGGACSQHRTRHRGRSGVLCGLGVGAREAGRSCASIGRCGEHRGDRRRHVPAPGLPRGRPGNAWSVALQLSRGAVGPVLVFRRTAQRVPFVLVAASRHARARVAGGSRRGAHRPGSRRLSEPRPHEPATVQRPTAPML